MHPCSRYRLNKEDGILQRSQASGLLRKPRKGMPSVPPSTFLY